MLKGDISYINTTLCIDDDCTLDDLMEKLRAVEDLLKEDLSNGTFLISFFAGSLID